MTMGAAYENDNPTISESEGIRYLHFGTEWIQGAMRVRKPHELVLAYTQQMMAWLLFTEPGRDSQLAILGLGAGSLLRFCVKHTQARITTVEWNPAVTGICHAFFRLPGTDRSHIEHEDAGAWVREPAHWGRYRALMVDLYDADAQGPVRDSIEFYQGCLALLEEGGVMSVNLFGNHPSFERNITHIRHAFQGRVLLLPEMDAGNQIVLAFQDATGLDRTAAQLLERASQVQDRYGLPAERWAREILSQSASRAVAAS